MEVSWCGICGTDLHEYLGGPLYIPAERPHPLTGVRAPVIIGHEMAAKVVAIGPGVKEFKEGDRMAACPIISCGECRWCRNGSMAQCDKVAFLGTSWSGGALSERLNLLAYQCYSIPAGITREKTVMGSMSGYGMYPEAIRMMTDPCFRGDLLITDRISLDELIHRGFHALLNEKDKHVKVLVRPS